MTTINQSIALLNHFLNLANFDDENTFHKSEFKNMNYNAYIDGSEKKLIEIKKEQSIKYKGIIFNIIVTGSLLYKTYELYMISMECCQIDIDDHLIIEEYLSNLMIHFTAIVHKQLSLHLSTNDFISSHFESAFQQLMNIHRQTNTSKNIYYLIHFICCPQLYYMEDNFYFKISPMHDLGIILELLLNIY